MSTIVVAVLSTIAAADTTAIAMPIRYSKQKTIYTTIDPTNCLSVIASYIETYLATVEDTERSSIDAADISAVT